MEQIDFTINTILSDVLARRQSEGALTREGFSDLVDEVLDEKRAAGELDDDTDIEQVRQALLAHWNEIADADAEEAAGAIPDASSSD